MNDTPEMKLCKALKAAAEEYCNETGRTFDPRFEFIEVDMWGESRKYRVSRVSISHTEETSA